MRCMQTRYVNGLTIRSLRDGDTKTVATLFARLGDRSRERRFCGAKPTLSEAELRALSRTDGAHHVLVGYVDGDPEPVAAFKRAVGSADGLLIATPEYNLGVPGVTKNVIDWASRPPRKSVLDRKPVAVMGATPGMGGTARGQSQLRQAFVFTNSYAMPQPEVLVRNASAIFDAEGRLTDEPTREHLVKFLNAFEEWIGRFRG